MSPRISQFIWLLGGFMILQCSSSPVNTRPKAIKSAINNRSNGFAVIELFTSQGCSSCPPADRKLNALTARAKDENLPIYTLAYHVDYWNRLGWKDPFSMKLFSDRQSWYSSLFESGSVYTPQIIVNGEQEMVGSRNAEIDRNIEQVLNEKSNIEIKLDIEAAGEDLICNVSIKNRPTASCMICLALVADDITTVVKRGENSGKTLLESGIVLNFKSTKLETDQLKIILKRTGMNGNRRVVAFIQDEKKGVIYGATNTNL